MDTPNAFYDEENTIFSPDGRLFQVEYAREAVKRGSIILGIKCKKCIILIAKKFYHSKIVDIRALEKIYQIDDSIGCAITGIVADAQHLVEVTRDEVQIHKMIYGEDISVKAIVGQICEYKHLYTQFTGARPFGAILLIAGLDKDGYHLYSTDPSGMFVEYKAVSIGQGGDIAMSFLQSKYAENLSFKNGVDLGLKTLLKVTKKKLQPAEIEIGIVDSIKKYYKLSTEEIKSIIK